MHHELKSNLGAPEQAAKAGGLLPVPTKRDSVANGTYVHISEARDLRNIKPSAFLPLKLPEQTRV